MSRDYFQPFRKAGYLTCFIAIKGLDRLQFASEIETLYPGLYRSAILLTGNSSEAEDLVQETVLRALDASKRFRGDCSLKTWLYSILVNVHRSQLRSNGRRWRRILTWFQHDSRHELGAEEIELRREWQESLWNAVAKLPTAQQQTMVLRFAESMQYEEISTAMNCPIGTVKSRLNAAIQKLNQDPDVQDLQHLCSVAPT